MTLGFNEITVLLALAAIMLIWASVEVGRNDAANLVNAVFGSRIMTRRMAVVLAGIAVILGATASSPVIETARKGIFDPLFLSTIEGVTTTEAVRMAMTIYVSVYIVNTVLLFSYSAYGMPVSTTATLIFSLIGASFALSGPGIVNWGKASTVIGAIIISILISGIASFFIQKAFRAGIGDKSADPKTVFLQGPWIAGAMLTWLTWFMLVKGLKNLELVEALKSQTLDEYGAILFLLGLWFMYYVLVHVFLLVTREKGAAVLFQITTVLGMLCMAFAFGQNDLANCASPGLATLTLWQHGDVDIATKVPISRLALLTCGIFIVVGMFTQNAQRVTRAAVNTGSQFDTVALWAPKWCCSLARSVMNLIPKPPSLAPKASVDTQGKKVHYDTLRASVIMAVSASVIAFASGHGLPVSTTYVAFSAVVFTGLADRVLMRGDSELKIGRTIWVIFSWFLSAVIAMISAGLVCLLLYHGRIYGIILAIVINLLIKGWADRRSKAQDDLVREEARQRMEITHDSDSEEIFSEF